MIHGTVRSRRSGPLRSPQVDEGKQLRTSGAFKYFSPEFHEQYADPESGARYGDVLVGGPLTKKPYFKELDPVAAFSEPGIPSNPTTI